MKEVTKQALKHAMEMLPPMKRKLDVDISNPNDQDRLIKVAVSLLDNNDTIELNDIRLVCEEIGEGYEKIISSNNNLFEEHFASKIYNKIDELKNIISSYRSMFDE